MMRIAIAATVTMNVSIRDAATSGAAFSTTVSVTMNAHVV